MLARMRNLPGRCAPKSSRLHRRKNPAHDFSLPVQTVCRVYFEKPLLCLTPIFLKSWLWMRGSLQACPRYYGGPNEISQNDFFSKGIRRTINLLRNGYVNAITNLNFNEDSNMSERIFQLPPHPRIVRPVPDPLGLYLRISPSDCSEMSDLIAAGDTSIFGVILYPALIK